MIGASISGVTFVSVPGNVMSQNFFYIPLVLGFCVGYAVVAELLMPLYWRRNITSIYEYVQERLGLYSRKTAGAAFIVARISSVAVRLFAAIIVINTFLPAPLREALPSSVLVAIVALALVGIIFPYAYKGGVRALVWTDVVQTTFMLASVALTIYHITSWYGRGFGDMFASAASLRINGDIPLWTAFDWDWSHGTNAVKQFLSGISITVAMTGLDQSMIQKSLSCRDLAASKKNMYMTAVNILLVNIFFLCFGMLLCWFVQQNGGMDAMGLARTDEIFPAVARMLGPGMAVIFVVGLVCATLPSAGNAIVALTTSVCEDFLGSRRHRNVVMVCFALIFVGIAVALEALSNDAVINVIYKVVSYTDGPILGIFAFGIFTRRAAFDKATPWIALASPAACLAINLALKHYLGFDMGYSLLLVNAVITFAGLCALSGRK